ncbi:MAG: MlaD family protein [Solirubrobacteraceae bacterium]
MVVLAVLIVAGTFGAGYVLVKQRLPVPFQDTYDVRVSLPAADGVAPGLGQGVNVSGVRVGSISRAHILRGTAELTLRIERAKLRHVYRDARADLRPITPLKDMEIDLDPGSPRAGELPDAASIGTARTSSPVPLSDLLSTLDADTRTFLEGLLRGAGRGTAGRAPDMRALLLALGPTARQLGDITRELDGRRRELARLVHNVSDVTRAAAADGRMAAVVAAGNQTLEALAREDEPLRRTLERLPGALRSTRAALTTTRGLADELGPTLKALTSPVGDLPATMRRLTEVTDRFTPVVRRDVRPLVRDAQSLATRLSPAVDGLTRLTPDLSRVLQVVTYAVNELAYNPPGKDEGMLFWLAWFIHNWNSTAGNGDAHGGSLRARISLNCTSMTEVANLAPLFNLILGTHSICPPE